MAVTYARLHNRQHTSVSFFFTERRHGITPRVTRLWRSIPRHGDIHYNAKLACGCVLRSDNRRELAALTRA